MRRYSIRLAALTLAIAVGLMVCPTCENPTQKAKAAEISVEIG